MDISERRFEDTIVGGLTGSAPGGYELRSPDDYDRGLCLDTGKVYEFIRATQPKQWERLRQHYGDDIREGFARRLASEIEKRGALDVIRHGVKDHGCHFELAYFVPSSGLNEELQRLYELNQFSVIRQLRYSASGEQRLDVALFLNGIPIFTAELKNRLNGQTVEDAEYQYRNDRDPREPLFHLGRCPAHFALDNERVSVTTHLDGQSTRFLPFNQGWCGGAGNPPSRTSFATAYLWERIWAPSSVLDLIQHFIHEFEETVEDDNGSKRKVRRLIFPRYHQLSAVRRMVRHARDTGAGHNYLIHHSAGSGKSNTIAWLAHWLSVLHDERDERVFDSIVVVTDRRVLDQQLQRTVRHFEQTLGVVETITGTSQQLKGALEGGKTIIVTTLQKFPVIVDEIGTLPGSRFAVLIDEAHSSQTGEAATKMKATLAAGSLDEAEAEEAGEPETWEDRMREEMLARGPQPNLSLFAFTATPKQRTLEMFGEKQDDGTFEAFSLYTMRQAIEEGFIIDVLENYATYKTYWALRKAIEEDPKYERGKAYYLLRQWVDLHPHNIEQKTRIILEHFEEHVRGRIGGRAKAMVVTRSRLHAVRYRLEIDRQLRELGQPYGALVAFTGTVPDGGMAYTEPGMNGMPETQTAGAFNQDQYRFLIVAEKFQTGFDQPLLHTMYVDRTLTGVHAVQTLSRANRVRPEKHETMVLDFANEAEHIQAAFEPYYDQIILSEATDPNILYDLERQLRDFGIFDQTDIDRVAEAYFDPQATQAQIEWALRAPGDRYEACEEDEQADFRSMLTKYVRQYAFLAQVIGFVDEDLEKLYQFARFLLRALPISRDELPRQVTEEIDLDSFRVDQTDEGPIRLERGVTEVDPIQEATVPVSGEEEKDALSQIIEELNERFGADLTEDDRVFLEQLEAKLNEDDALAKSVQANTSENARLTFDMVVNDTLQDMIDANFQLYKRIYDDEQFGSALLSWLFESYLTRARAEESD